MKIHHLTDFTKTPDQYLPEDFITAWEADGKYDDSALDVESLRVPMIHAKYLRYLSTARIKVKRLGLKRSALFVLLRQYYLGNLNTDSEALASLHREPMRDRHLKQDVLMHIDADADMQIVDLQMAEAHEIVSVLEEILKSINNRGFQIKNAIEWRRLTNFAI